MFFLDMTIEEMKNGGKYQATLLAERVTQSEQE
jgi:hypothetical protein